MKRIRIVFAGAAALLCVALAGMAVCVLAVPLGRFSPYLDILGQFAPQAGLGAGAISMLYALLRLRVMTVLSLGTALSSWAVIHPASELAACKPEHRPEHRIVFFNLWAGNPTIGATADYLATLDADAIVLVEMRPAFKPAIRKLAQIYPYQTPCPGRCSQIIFSRIPFRDVTAHVAQQGEPYDFAALEMNYPDGALTLVGVHLTRPWPFMRPEAQARQAHVLARQVARLKGPHMVLGDFNAVRWGAIVSRLTEKTRLVALDGGGTWRSNLPGFARLPIDQALLGPGFSCATKTTGPAIGSDHLPVIVDFALAR